ncbi:hypothetical protein HanIR_Chr01g0021171 [Helianthus annuus]|nr:hypothetical protein HanIR_Chr01g0021171 [Helianthus annuus]
MVVVLTFAYAASRLPHPLCNILLFGFLNSKPSKVSPLLHHTAPHTIVSLCRLINIKFFILFSARCRFSFVVDNFMFRSILHYHGSTLTSFFLAMAAF